MMVKLFQKERFFRPDRFADYDGDASHISEYADIPAGTCVNVVKVVNGLYTLEDAEGHWAKVWASWVEN